MLPPTRRFVCMGGNFWWACAVLNTQHTTMCCSLSLASKLTLTLPGSLASAPRSEHRPAAATAAGEEEVGAGDQGGLRRSDRPSPAGVQQPQGQPPPPHPPGQGDPGDLAGEALAEPLPDRGGEAVPGAELSHHRYTGEQRVFTSEPPLGDSFEFSDSQPGLCVVHLLNSSTGD